MGPEKGLALLLSDKPKERESKPEMESEGEDYTSIAQDVLDAIGSKDAEALGLALKRFHMSCAEDE